MIIELNKNTQIHQISDLINWLQEAGYKATLNSFDDYASINVEGVLSNVDVDFIKTFPFVSKVIEEDNSHLKTSRSYQSEDTVIEFKNTRIGNGNFCIIAGPCTIESKEQLDRIAPIVKDVGADFLRGGAFKPRTSPYAFQGLREKGLELLADAGKEYDLPVVTELMNPAHIELFEDIDLIQVGAKNMQNYELLKEVGLSNKPVLLKRGMHSTLEDLLMSAEYIMANGNSQIILCERGVQAFETITKNTLDLAAVPMLKKLTHLPVIVDPSHGTGLRELVKPMCMAATAAGADGIMLEVHHNPDEALCDGRQSVTLEEFENIVNSIAMIQPFAYRP